VFDLQANCNDKIHFGLTTVLLKVLGMQLQIISLEHSDHVVKSWKNALCTLEHILIKTSSEGFTIQGFNFEINDFKGPGYFCHFGPSPFSKGLPTHRHGEGLAPNLLVGLVWLPLPITDQTGAIEPAEFAKLDLKILLCELQRVYQKPVVVLIDKYDLPMHSTIEHGYAALVHSFILLLGPLLQLIPHVIPGQQFLYCSIRFVAEGLSASNAWDTVDWHLSIEQWRRVCKYGWWAYVGL
jgi:hypothetical protein